MRRSRPFLEVFACAVKEDHRFPILEVFALVFTFGVFAILDLEAYAWNGEVFAYRLVSSLWGFPLSIIFVILILKNIAYGLGSDLDKGVIQTLFSYPLTRRSILRAKLLSAVGVVLLLVVGIQVFALLLLVPDVITAHSSVVFLTYAANLCSPALLLAGLVLLLTLLLKRGGLPLVFGVVSCLAFAIISPLVTSIASATGSDLAMRIWAVIDPNLALQSYYLGTAGLPYAARTWVPSFAEVILHLVAGFLIVAVIFIVAYRYFERRLGI